MTHQSMYYTEEEYVQAVSALDAIAFEDARVAPLRATLRLGRGTENAVEIRWIRLALEEGSAQSPERAEQVWSVIERASLHIAASLPLGQLTSVLLAARYVCERVTERRFAEDEDLFDLLREFESGLVSAPQGSGLPSLAAIQRAAAGAMREAAGLEEPQTHMQRMRDEDKEIRTKQAVIKELLAVVQTVEAAPGGSPAPRLGWALVERVHGHLAMKVFHAGMHSSGYSDHHWFDREDFQLGLVLQVLRQNNFPSVKYPGGDLADKLWSAYQVAGMGGKGRA